LPDKASIEALIARAVRKAVPPGPGCDWLIHAMIEIFLEGRADGPDYIRNDSTAAVLVANRTRDSRE
jgi:hypothetical protein